MNKLRRFFLKKQNIFISMIAVLLSFLVVGVLLIVTKRNPLDALYYFAKGSFGSLRNTSDTFSRMIPLSIAGIAFLVGAKCSVFNVGIEGQLLIGALASAIVGWVVKLPAIIHLPLMLLAGSLAGALYALFPAWLKTYRGVNDILSTIMMNYPAFFLTHYITVKVLPITGVVPATPMIQETARFGKLIEGTSLHTGIFVAILVAIFAYILLQKTSMGYEMRAVGLNRVAARFHGIQVEKRMIFSFILSGALAGLAGAVQVAGVHYRFLDQFSPGYGFDSITVALVAMLNPFAVLVSALLFGALKTGMLEMAVYTDIPRQLVTLLNGIVVLFISAKSGILSSYLKVIKGNKDFDAEKEIQ